MGAPCDQRVAHRGLGGAGHAAHGGARRHHCAADDAHQRDATWVDVSTAAQVEYIDQNQNADIASGSTTPYLAAHIALTANISLSGFAWTPFGTRSTEFTGTFNGNGYQVTGVTIHSSAVYVGFFGVANGTIENVSLVGVRVDATGSGANVGGLVGAQFGSITDATVTGTVSATGAATVGGLVGTQYGSITDVAAAAVTVTAASGGMAGGLVGSATGSTITDAHATGTVAVDGSGDAGGLLGSGGVNGGVDVTDAYATGAVTAGAGDAGGLIGYVFGGSNNQISNTYATGAVQGSTAGGMLGTSSIGASNGGPLSFSASFWDTGTNPGTGVSVGVGPGSRYTGSLTGATTSAMEGASLYTAAGWTSGPWYFAAGAFPSLQAPTTVAVTTTPTTATAGRPVILTATVAAI